MGPRNITRIEEERDVFIPCPFWGPYVPIWEINGVQYEHSTFPEPYKLERFGLLITMVERRLNNTMYRCLYPTGKRFQIKSSEVGYLLVLGKD